MKAFKLLPLLLALCLTGCGPSRAQKLEDEHIYKQQMIASRYMSGEITHDQAYLMSNLTLAEYNQKISRAQASSAKPFLIAAALLGGTPSGEKSKCVTKPSIYGDSIETICEEQ